MKIQQAGVKGLQAALVVAGCGDGEEPGSFVAEVGTICEDALAQFAEANRNVVFESDAKKNKSEFRAANQPVYDEFISDLEAVEPQTDLANAYEAFVAAIRDQADVLLGDPGAVASASLSGKQNETTRKLLEVNEKVERVTAELGLPSCAGVTGDSQSG